jgi:hypothetical protein
VLLLPLRRLQVSDLPASAATGAYNADDQSGRISSATASKGPSTVFVSRRGSRVEPNDSSALAGPGPNQERAGSLGGRSLPDERGRRRRPPGCRRQAWIACSSCSAFTSAHPMRSTSWSASCSSASLSEGACSVSSVGGSCLALRLGPRFGGMCVPLFVEIWRCRCVGSRSRCRLSRSGARPPADTSSRGQASTGRSSPASCWPPTTCCMAWCYR